MGKLYKRFTEPSTWAGIAGVALAIAPSLPPPWHIYMQGVATAAGALAAAMREKGANA